MTQHEITFKTVFKSYSHSSSFIFSSVANTIQKPRISAAFLKKLLFLQSAAPPMLIWVHRGHHSNRPDRRPPSTYHFLRKLSPHWFLPEWSDFPMLLQQRHHSGPNPKTLTVLITSGTYSIKKNYIFGRRFLFLCADWYSHKTDWLFFFPSSLLKTNISNVQSRVNVAEGT